jgi:hypothetical protein
MPFGNRIIPPLPPFERDDAVEVEVEVEGSESCFKGIIISERSIEFGKLARATSCSQSGELTNWKDLLSEQTSPQTSLQYSHCSERGCNDE